MKLALALAGVLALAGCQSIDKQLQANGRAICSSLDYSHNLFLVGIQTGKVQERWILDEYTLYQHIQALCVDPDKLDTIKVLTAAALAYAKLTEQAKI